MGGTTKARLHGYLLYALSNMKTSQYLNVFSIDGIETLGFDRFNSETEARQSGKRFNTYVRTELAPPWQTSTVKAEDTVRQILKIVQVSCRKTKLTNELVITWKTIS